MCVDALATMSTGTLQTLLNVLLAGLAFESTGTVALELATAAHRLARASVFAWTRGADILFLAMPPRVSRLAGALVLVQRLQHAVSVILAWR